MGSATSAVDDAGRRKAKCLECGKFYHRVDVHAAKAHSLDAEAYMAKHPKGKLLSDWAKDNEEALSKTEAEPKKAKAPKPEETEALRFGAAELFERTELEAQDLAHVPMHDEQWKIGPNEHTNLEALALAMQMNENCLIVGPPGVGKSTLARELASVCNQPMIRLPFNGEMRTSDLLGGSRIIVDPASGQAITKFVNGPLPLAAERGYWVVAEEFDSSPSQVTFALHSALERPRQLRLMEDNREVDFHEKFRFIATANTLGYGDETGLYAGTAPMNEALLDRFGIVIRMDYPSKEEEIEILIERTGIKKTTAELLADVSDKVRKAQKSEQTMVSLSPRRMIMWAMLTTKMSSPRAAAKLTILNKLPPQDLVFVDGLIQRIFGSK